MQRYRILWVDDEIELLKPYVIFLEEKGFNVITFTNPYSLLENIEVNQKIDIILLDENMPGLNGIEVLNKIKKINPLIPVIMITKNEAEDIMDDAIGNKISDYLIKPLNPNQIFISIKRILDNKKIISQKTKTKYRKVFSEISNSINNNMNYKDWIDLYSKISFWELELDKFSDESLVSIIKSQKEESNFHFLSLLKPK